MLDKNTYVAFRFSPQLSCATLVVLMIIGATSVRASTTVSVGKDCSFLPTSPCTVTGDDGVIIHITSTQTVHWEATRTGTLDDHLGHSFSLISGGATTTITSGLTSGSSQNGTFTLTPGNYQINIHSSSMGPGAYSVTFNLTASLTASPASHTFTPALVAGSAPSSSFSFTVASPSTADVPVTISSVTSDDPHFEVTAPNPSGQVVPPSRTVHVRFNPLATPGSFTGHVTVSGTSEVGPVNRVITVTGTTLPNVPNLACGSGSGSNCAASTIRATADGDATPAETQVFTVSFQNNGAGTAPLNITSIVLVSDLPGVFALEGAPITTPLAHGAIRDVSIRFTPPPGEATYCGHLVISSNDPDSPINCFFRARGHHPAPHMRLESTLLDYHQVELGFTSTKVIVVYNDGDLPLNVNVVDNCGTDAACIANQMQWDSRETGMFTIPGATSPAGPVSSSFAQCLPTPAHPNPNPRCFRMAYQPNSLSPPPHVIQMRVSGNDLLNPSQDVTLRAEAIAPIPIDSVLVLDRSGSMAGLVGPHRKIEALRTASDMFVHLLRPETGSGTGDTLGLVKYDNEHEVYLPRAPLEATSTPGSHLEAAEQRLSEAAIADAAQIAPRGTTGIGGGIETAGTMFPAPTTTRKHVMVVVTDGVENVFSPPIATAVSNVHTADPSLWIFSIGVGLPSEIDAPALQSITNVTHGYHQITDDLSGVSQYELESFYFKIFSEAVGMMMVVDPTTPVVVSGPDPIVVNKAHIVSSDHSVTFMVLDEPALRTFYHLEMLTPGGVAIDPSTAVGGITVQQQQRNNYSLYKVIFPDESEAANYVGDWVLRLVPNGTWDQAAAEEALQCQANGTPTHAHASPASSSITTPQKLRDTPCERLKRRPDAINPFVGQVPIGFGAAVSSDYRMEVKVLPSVYLPGADVKLTASLSDRGMPAPTGTVFVDVTTPGHILHSNLPLFDDGTHGDDVATDGTWTTHFTQTIENGSYKFFFHAIGANERGELAPREATRYASLMFPKLPGNNDGKGDRALWFSFHLGHGFPVGSFRHEYNSGPSVTFDAEYSLRRNLSLYGMLGYHYFNAKTAGSKDLSYTNLSLNLRAYFPVSGWQGYVQFGPGVYFSNLVSTKPGFNVGTGLDFSVLPKLSIELGADLHYVNPGGLNRFFFDPKLGIKFRF
jgi:von Willebrand factor type A domain